MIKVITYGTFDLLHSGHVRLLERAKKLGDYLIVGVTADDFDKARGKINVKQSLMERIASVQMTGLADEIIVEEYEGQKIDDIKRYNVDIFTVGSDWIGKFDYLEEYCKVAYLARTENISSSEIRAVKRENKIGIVGEAGILDKFFHECDFVNGVAVTSIYSRDKKISERYEKKGIDVVRDYNSLLKNVDSVYVVSHPKKHYKHVKEALMQGKHVLCESPIAINRKESEELFALAKEKKLILMESIKTAYSMAYNRLLLLLKSGKIGEIVSVDATCTSLRGLDTIKLNTTWNSICSWGPTAMLPVFQILGTNYKEVRITSLMDKEKKGFDLFSKVDFTYNGAVASIKVGKGVKSEGELIVSGTRGYIYVPAPWWKTDYYEIRYENTEDNKRCFYQLDGEGIRYEIVEFVKSIEGGEKHSYIDENISVEIATIVEKVECGEYCEL